MVENALTWLLLGFALSSLDSGIRASALRATLSEDLTIGGLVGCTGFLFHPSFLDIDLPGFVTAALLTFYGAVILRSVLHWSYTSIEQA